jgi:hypothetical protein
VQKPKWVDTDEKGKGKGKQKAKPVDEEEDMDIDGEEESDDEELGKDDQGQGGMNGLEEQSDDDEEPEDIIGKGKKKMTLRAKASNALDMLEGEEQISGGMVICKKRKSLHEDGDNMCM